MRLLQNWFLLVFFWSVFYLIEWNYRQYASIFWFVWCVHTDLFQCFPFSVGEPEAAAGDLWDGWRGGSGQPDQRVPQGRSSAQACCQEHICHGEAPIPGQNTLHLWPFLLRQQAIICQTPFDCVYLPLQFPFLFFFCQSKSHDCPYTF